jgi:NAD(P)H-nitrite reductase large subunit
MEVASCLAKKAKSIIVVGMEEVPFERVLGREIGRVLQRFHEKNGVTFRMKRVVRELRGTEGVVEIVVLWFTLKVRGVLLDSGELLDCDICVVGAGVIPTTKFVRGVTIERDQSIVCDKFLQAADGLYAGNSQDCISDLLGGDIARYPYYLTGESVRIEHWGMAQNHGLYRR